MKLKINVFTNFGIIFAFHLKLKIWKNYWLHVKKKRKGDGCCRPWIDPKEEEKKRWDEFKRIEGELVKEDIFKPEFLEDLMDTSENMFSARDIISQMEEKYEFWEENHEEMKVEDAFNLIYEMTELMDFLTAKMEDIEYFLVKLEDVDWKDYLKTENNEEIEELDNSLANLIKEQYEILYQILRIRYESLEEHITFMTMEENDKKYFPKKHH